MTMMKYELGFSVTLAINGCIAIVLELMTVWLRMISMFRLIAMNVRRIRRERNEFTFSVHYVIDLLDMESIFIDVQQNKLLLFVFESRVYISSFTHCFHSLHSLYSLWFSRLCHLSSAIYPAFHCQHCLSQHPSRCVLDVERSRSKARY